MDRDTLASAQEDVSQRRRRLQQCREQLQDRTLADYARAIHHPQVRFVREQFKCCKTLHGHTGKIYSLDWSYGNTNRIVSASQDGRLIVWNALTSQKTHAIKLECPWVMACAFAPAGNAVASGGLDNKCSIFNLGSAPDSNGNLPVSQTLAGHRGYISCCRFVPPQGSQIITSSGDYTCALWDVEANQRISVFGGDVPSGHTSDVMCLAISSDNPQLFVSGSCDATAKLWDTRITSRARCTYLGHTADVNAVQFLPGGNSFATGSDDGTCKLYDIRYGYLLQEYVSQQLSQVRSLAFSHTGRILIAGYDNQKCILWDTMFAEELHDIGSGHSRHVSCLGVAPDGSALCTGSWDSILKIWAYQVID